jgi:hypothetical protein
VALAVAGTAGTSPAAAAIIQALARAPQSEGACAATRPSCPKNPTPPPAPLTSAAAETEISESGPSVIIACVGCGARAAAASIWRGMACISWVGLDWILQFM